MKLKVVLSGLIPIMILFSCLVSENLAQEQQHQQCMNELRFCINYLNNDTSQPSDSCCQPLDYVIKTIPECLCNLMNFMGANVAEQIGINVSNAQALPSRCGQHINPLRCITGTPDARSQDSIPNSASSKFWSLSSVVVVGGSSMILILQGL
ncbi:hypothetical protein DH2020_021761 [Rehmannia glutinosa]|uniref:Bifunctional inhibitor/plant lipid transfer protein/seed storage helical domain-containing protein n=1 Tax=Rehmannia glutinosa TaxID=99300 RepID=A0ABR0WDS3_REHGL